MKTIQELKDSRAKDSKSLYLEIKNLENKLTELRFKSSFRKLKNYQEIKLIRKKIARIWTILAERAIEKLSK